MRSTPFCLIKGDENRIEGGWPLGIKRGEEANLREEAFLVFFAFLFEHRKALCLGGLFFGWRQRIERRG